MTTWVSQNQKGKSSLDLNKARDNGVLRWQWRQLDHIQTICSLLQTDNHTNTSSLNFYRPVARLTPNQQCQSTEGNTEVFSKLSEDTNITNVNFLIHYIQINWLLAQNSVTVEFLGSVSHPHKKCTFKCIFNKHMLAKNVKYHWVINHTMSSNQFLWYTMALIKREYLGKGDVKKRMKIMQFKSWSDTKCQDNKCRISTISAYLLLPENVAWVEAIHSKDISCRYDNLQVNVYVLG